VKNAAVIKVEGLHKKFCINQRKSMIYGGHDIFRNMIGLPQKRDILRDKEIWALKDINFEVNKGETLGIIGVNGAGKSTMLRVLTGIYPPDAGKISVKGPIGALIAAGAGFHPDMTGRENIYLNGTIVGLKKKEIDGKLDEIIEFAEIGEFIDTPVRFYSSGMYVRLGFAIAANIRPKILLIDEILSVGDLTFQNKCFRKLKEMRDSVDAVIFVSHNLDSIRNVCSDIILLDAGEIRYHGDVEEGIVRYQALADDLKKKSMDAEMARQKIPGSFSFDSSEVKLESIEIGNQTGENNGVISKGDDLVITIRFRTQREILRPQFSVGIQNDRNTPVLWQMDHDNNIHFDKLHAGNYQLKVIFKRLALVAGVYRVAFAVRDADSCEILTKHKRFKTFTIRGEQLSRAIVDCESMWELEDLSGKTPVN